MGKQKVTPALRQLNQAGADYQVLTYRCEERGGATHAAEALSVPLHQMIKTIVFMDDTDSAWFVLMHGDREISAKQLAREAGVKKMTPAEPRKVTTLTGYKVGGTSPFGSRRQLPVMVEESILDYDEIYINAGARGSILRLSTEWLEELLDIRIVNVAIEAAD